MIEFTAKKFDLLRELTLIQGVVERKATIPILQNVLLECRDDGLGLEATDLEIGIRTSCPAKMKSSPQSGITIPAKRFFDIVRALPDADIKIKAQENNWITVNCERTAFRLVGTSRENFPQLPDLKTVVVSIPAKILSTLITKTAFSISTEESRYTLNGALLLIKPNSLAMVATDGHRLALIEKEHGFDHLNSEVRALVPKKAMAELTRLLGEADEKTEIEFGKDENHLFFRMGKRLLVSRMLTGQFPNYEAVLPRDNDRVVSLDREAVTAALKRVMLLSDERSHAVKLNIAERRMEIFSSHAEYGEAKEELEVDYRKEAFEIGFNCQYLLDFLSVVTEDKVSFEFKDEQSAGLMRPITSDGYSYRYVVMPMRI